MLFKKPLKKRLREALSSQMLPGTTQHHWGEFIGQVQEQEKGLQLEMYSPYLLSAEELKVTVERLSQHLVHTFKQSIHLQLTFSAPRFAHANQVAVWPKVQNVVAVLAGKGGVGKSTVTVGLAKALTALGARVGILDADIYGPNIPILLGTSSQRAAADAQGLLQPIMLDSIATMSMAYLIDETQALVWRGPMASKAVEQTASQTDWPLLDYLLIDMPPGTGDIPLTIAQKMPITAAMVVSIDHPMAESDRRRAAVMLDKVHIPLLGRIANWCYQQCDVCGARQSLFQPRANDGPILAEIPVVAALMQQGEFADTCTDYFYPLAYAFSQSMLSLPLDVSSQFGKIQSAFS